MNISDVLNIKNFSMALFITGLVLQGCGFFFTNLENYPTLKRLITPSTVRAHKVLSILSDGEEISEKGIGLAELNSMYIEYKKRVLQDRLPIDAIEKRNRFFKLEPAIPRTISFEDRVKMKSKHSFLFDSSSIKITFKPYLSFTTKGKSKVVSFIFLESIVKEVEKSKIHQFTAFIFLSGIFLQIIGFFLKPAGRRMHNNHGCSDKGPTSLYTIQNGLTRRCTGPLWASPQFPPYGRRPVSFIRYVAQERRCRW